MSYCDDSEDKENSPDGNNNKKKPKSASKSEKSFSLSRKSSKSTIITDLMPKPSTGYKITGGIVLPPGVPGTDISIRPGDSTTYIVGTVAGDVLFVSVI